VHIVLHSALLQLTKRLIGYILSDVMDDGFWGMNEHPPGRVIPQLAPLQFH